MNVRLEFGTSMRLAANSTCIVRPVRLSGADIHRKVFLRLEGDQRYRCPLPRNEMVVELVSARVELLDYRMRKTHVARVCATGATQQGTARPRVRDWLTSSFGWRRLIDSGYSDTLTALLTSYCEVLPCPNFCALPMASAKIATLLIRVSHAPNTSCRDTWV